MAERLIEEVSRDMFQDGEAWIEDEVIFSQVPDYIWFTITCSEEGFPNNLAVTKKLFQGESISWQSASGATRFEFGIYFDGNTVYYGYYDPDAEFSPTITFKAYSEQVLINIASLSNIANAIREKKGVTKKYSPSEMVTAISEIQSGGVSLDDYFNSLVAEYNLSSATKIKRYAFYEDNTIQQITMPNVTEIGAYAFKSCKNLVKATFPETLTTLGNSSFHGCSKLEIAKIPDSVVSMGEYAFFSCSKLAATSLPENLSALKSYTFYQCDLLAISSIPASVTSIESRAFSGCKGITSLTFKGTPTSISSNVFEYCTNLLTINVPWAEGAVANAPWGATNATINYNYGGD